MNEGRGQLRKFFSLSCREKRFFAEAFVLHLWVGLVLKVVPFRRIPGVFSSPKSATYAKASVAGSSLQSEDVVLIKGAIQRAGRVSPWKNRCLVSSLAGRCMLRRRKIESLISLGVAKDAGGKVIAHAWLRAGGFEIVPADETFRTLYQF